MTALMHAGAGSGSDFDAIVVGGGLAGITAARDLSKNGMRTLLVEARSRLGGRTEQQTLAGRPIDSGGTWFHWFQSAIWTEVQRYELEVVERPNPENYIMGIGGKLISMSPADLDRRLQPALVKFWTDPSFTEGLTRPFAVRRGGDAMAKIDSLSVEDRLRAIKLDPLEESLIRGTFIDFGRPLDQVSLGWVLQRVANGVWSYEAFNALFAVYRLKDGMKSLIDKMISDGGFAVRLSSPVAAIQQDDSGISVQLRDGMTLTARLAVVATPVNVWKSIRFLPALPESHQAASREGVTTTLSTFMIHVRGVPRPITGFAPFGQEAFDGLVTYDHLGGDEQILAGFSANGAIPFAAGGHELLAAVRRYLPQAKIVDYVGHDWHSEEFAMGGAGALQPGQLTRFLDVLDQPQGRLFFASGDVSHQFSGFLTGAIEAGIRAARRATTAREAGIAPSRNIAA